MMPRLLEHGQVPLQVGSLLHSIEAGSLLASGVVTERQSWQETRVDDFEGPSWLCNCSDILNVIFSKKFI